MISFAGPAARPQSAVQRAALGSALRPAKMLRLVGQDYDSSSGSESESGRDGGHAEQGTIDAKLAAAKHEAALRSRQAATTGGVKRGKQPATRPGTGLTHASIAAAMMVSINDPGDLEKIRDELPPEFEEERSWTSAVAIEDIFPAQYLRKKPPHSMPAQASDTAAATPATASTAATASAAATPAATTAASAATTATTTAAPASRAAAEAGAGKRAGSGSGSGWQTVAEGIPSAGLVPAEASAGQGAAPARSPSASPAGNPTLAAARAKAPLYRELSDLLNARTRARPGRFVPRPPRRPEGLDAHVRGVRGPSGQRLFAYMQSWHTEPGPAPPGHGAAGPVGFAGTPRVLDATGWGFGGSMDLPHRMRSPGQSRSRKGRTAKQARAVFLFALAFCRTCRPPHVGTRHVRRSERNVLDPTTHG